MKKSRYVYQVNIGSTWRERLNTLSQKMANADRADLCRWGLQILEQTAASTPWLSYGTRLNGRSISDILAQLWQMWVDGEIVLTDDEPAQLSQ